MRLEAPPPDAHISRCPECGMWRWRGFCPKCSERLAGGAISQQALPPYQMHCWGCGETWTPDLPKPPDAQGAVFDRMARAHWKTCKSQP